MCPLIERPFIDTTTKSSLGNYFLERFNIIIHIGYTNPASNPPHANLMRILLQVTYLLVSLVQIESLLRLTKESVVTSDQTLFKQLLLTLPLK